jgi:hypothetical protein
MKLVGVGKEMGACGGGERCGCGRDTGPCPGTSRVDTGLGHTYTALSYSINGVCPGGIHGIGMAQMAYKLDLPKWLN